MAKALTYAALKLDRATAENARLRKALDDLTPALTDMKKRIAALEAQPLPAKAALRSVTKTADGADERAGQRRRRRSAPGFAACS